jgi:hypothetical protein
MRVRIEDVQVDDPREAMSRFRSALAHIVKVPKIATRRRRGDAQPKKKRRA